MNNDFYFSIDSCINLKNSEQLKFIKHANEIKITKVARQIEGLFLHMMLKSMRNSFPKDTLINTSQERIYEDIYDQFITQNISKVGLGFSKVIKKQILKLSNIDLKE
ncbi:MAG: rod-binding protein [Buchnera aphidicola (Schlechtendalia peitan)]